MSRVKGNWTGNGEDPAGRHELAGDGSTLSDVRHQVDAFNRITEITENGVSQAMVSDPNGNLVFDGAYVYQYDAWNRLTDVNLAGSLVYTSP